MIDNQIDAILSSGVYLDSIGIYNWALTKDQALVALCKFEDENFVVLGGDVYELDDKGYNLIYPGWYCERNNGENLIDYLHRSIMESKKFILNYKIIHKKEIFFSITACTLEELEDMNSIKY